MTRIKVTWTPGQGCGDGWHVSHGNSRLCECGKAANPAYRTWWQRVMDRRARKRIQRSRR